MQEKLRNQAIPDKNTITWHENNRQIKCILVASLAVSGHLFVDPITYNGLLLDASYPWPENRTLPNTCQWAIDIEIIENDMFGQVWKFLSIVLTLHKSKSLAWLEHCIE
jgi:hypothetical protein